MEDEMVEFIRGLVENGIEAFGLRDDAGLVHVPDAGQLVVSVDSVVAGVHVDLSICSPADVGWKALMGALSDLAAMGAAPLGALIALCVPGGAGDGEVALGVMGGVAEASGASGCPVVGGDVSSSPALVVAVTVLGTVERGGGGGGGGAGGGNSEPGPVPRSGAAVGDALLVTGPCGGSAAGLRGLRAGAGGRSVGLAYCRPVARLREGALARRCGAHAMIDVSDGFALDLHRLADASGVGFRLESVPVAAGATLDEALGGGEDYELLLALAEADVPHLLDAFDKADLREPLPFGHVLADAEVRLLGDQELERLGWQHRLG
ncbi:MAG TPA: thiamine-phosphate kinase [Acidimicrobiales bacterium]